MISGKKIEKTTKTMKKWIYNDKYQNESIFMHSRKNVFHDCTNLAIQIKIHNASLSLLNRSVISKQVNKTDNWYYAIGDRQDLPIFWHFLIFWFFWAINYRFHIVLAL